MDKDLVIHHELLAEVESLKADIQDLKDKFEKDLKVLEKKIKHERRMKCRYKRRWEKIKPHLRPKWSFKTQKALNLIAKRANTDSDMTLASISKASGLNYTYVVKLSTRYRKGEIVL